ncbi:MAG: rhamnulokinase [Spirochaetales bacterium]|nr:rhamnulokinase [Spirochaetales bacterium]
MIKRFVAVDLGAESGRVIVGTVQNEFNLEVMNRFPTRNTRVDGSLYWDVLFIFAKIKEGLSKAVSLYGEEISSIGVDTWGVDYGLIDSKGQLIGNPFHYRDDRTDGMMEKVFQKIDKNSMYHETGTQFMQINTAFQLAAELENNPEKINRAERFLMMPDLFNYWLSALMANEYSICSTSQLFNPSEKKWSEKIIDALNLKNTLFGDVVKSGTVLGSLNPKLARELGIKHDIKVVSVAGHDTASAVAAAPADEKISSAYLSSGTWSLLGIEIPEPNISEKSIKANLTNEGAADGGIRFLKNIMGLWILQECKRYWEAEGSEIDYGELAKASAEADDLFTLDVDDPRFLKPGRGEDSMPGRIIAYCNETGQKVPSSHAEFARGIFKGLASAYAKNIETISSVSGKKIDVLHIIGGGSQNMFLNQMTANAAGIKVTAGPIEATAIGNLMMQAVALGVLENQEEGRSIIRSGKDIKTFLPE